MLDMVQTLRHFTLLFAELDFPCWSVGVTESKFKIAVQASIRTLSHTVKVKMIHFWASACQLSEFDRGVYPVGSTARDSFPSRHFGMPLYFQSLLFRELFKSLVGTADIAAISMKTYSIYVGAKRIVS